LSLGSKKGIAFRTVGMTFIFLLFASVVRANCVTRVQFLVDVIEIFKPKLKEMGKYLSQDVWNTTPDDDFYAKVFAEYLVALQRAFESDPSKVTSDQLEINNAGIAKIDFPKALGDAASRQKAIDAFLNNSYFAYKKDKTDDGILRRRGDPIFLNKRQRDQNHKVVFDGDGNYLIPGTVDPKNVMEKIREVSWATHEHSAHNFGYAYLEMSTGDGHETAVLLGPDGLKVAIGAKNSVGGTAFEAANGKIIFHTHPVGDGNAISGGDVPEFQKCARNYFNSGGTGFKLGDNLHLIGPTPESRAELARPENWFKDRVDIYGYTPGTGEDGMDKEETIPDTDPRFTEIWNEIRRVFGTPVPFAKPKKIILNPKESKDYYGEG